MRSALHIALLSVAGWSWGAVWPRFGSKRQGELRRGGLQSSELENGVNGADAALRSGDGVGSGAGAAQSSGGDFGVGVTVIVVGVTVGFCRWQGLWRAKRLRLIRRNRSRRCLRVSLAVGADGEGDGCWWGRCGVESRRCGNGFSWVFCGRLFRLNWLRRI